MAPEEIPQPSSLAQQLRSFMGKPMTSEISEREKNALRRTGLEFYPMIFCSLIWVELPLLDVHHPLPDGVPHDILLDPGQHRERGVLVRKALKQHTRHLPPLYPVTIRKIILHHASAKDFLF